MTTLASCLSEVAGALNAFPQQDITFTMYDASPPSRVLHIINGGTVAYDMNDLQTAIDKMKKLKWHVIVQHNFDQSSFVTIELNGDIAFDIANGKRIMEWTTTMKNTVVDDMGDKSFAPETAAIHVLYHIHRFFHCLSHIPVPAMGGKRKQQAKKTQPNGKAAPKPKKTQPKQ